MKNSGHRRSYNSDELLVLTACIVHKTNFYISIHGLPSICHIDFPSNTISILPHSGVFVVVGNKLENVALLFSSHLSFSSKFAGKPILVVCSIVK